MLDGDDLLKPFRSTAGDVERIGIEVECGTLDVKTGKAAHYEGARGTRRLLEIILEEEGGEPLIGFSGPVGIRFTGGETVSLEAAGAFEYSSRPADDVATL